MEYSKKEEIIKGFIKAYSFKFFNKEEARQMVEFILNNIDDYKLLNNRVRSSFQHILKERLTVNEIIIKYLDDYFPNDISEDELHYINEFFQFLKIYNISINKEEISYLLDNSARFMTFYKLCTSIKTIRKIKNTNLANNINYVSILNYRKTTKKDSMVTEGVIIDSKKVYNLHWDYVAPAKEVGHIASLYDIYKDIDKDIVNKAVAMLSSEDRKYLEYRWGSDYSVNELSSLWKDEYYVEFSNIVFMKLNNNIKVLYLSNIKNPFISSNYSKKVINIVLNNLSGFDNDLLIKLYGQDFSSNTGYIMTDLEVSYFKDELLTKIKDNFFRIDRVLTLNENDDILLIYLNNIKKVSRDTFYVDKLTEYMKTDDYKNLRYYLSLEESLIYILSTGVVDKKYYHSYSLGRVLFMKNVQVEEMLTNILDKFDGKGIKRNKKK